MQVGAVTQSIEVNGAAAALETDSSDRGQVINRQAIVELPFNGRNYSDLALLTTNVHKSIYAYAVPPREGAFNANGMRSTYNNFMMDGVDNNAYSTSNQGYSNQVAQPSPDAIAEFKVITSNYSAEYGRVGGAVVNVAMRSGTNQIHGTRYEFLRNTDLNAVGFIFGRLRSSSSLACSGTSSASPSAGRSSRTSSSSSATTKASGPRSIRSCSIRFPP